MATPDNSRNSYTKPGILLVCPMMPHVMEAIEADFTVHRLWEASDQGTMPGDVAKGIRAIGTDGYYGAGAHLMDSLPNLEIVACYGVGVDAIDVAHAKQRGVIVTNTPDVLNDDVANMAIALLLATSRRLCEGDRYVREGRWRSGAMALTRGLRDRQVGILGLGRIGKDIAQKAEVFGCRLAYHGRSEQPGQPYRYYANLVEMARDSDFLVVSCSGGTATAKLVSAEVLAALGPEGTLINVSRGSVIDEAALVAALGDGRLGAAGLDVFADEPGVPEALLVMENLVLSPHQGSATVETRRAMGDLVIENLRAHFAGRPVPTAVS